MPKNIPQLPVFTYQFWGQLDDANRYRKELKILVDHIITNLGVCPPKIVECILQILTVEFYPAGIEIKLPAEAWKNKTEIRNLNEFPKELQQRLNLLSAGYRRAMLRLIELELEVKFVFIRRDGDLIQLSIFVS